MKLSTKKVKCKIGGIIGGIAMLLNSAQGLAAQDNAPPPPRTPYNPRVGDSATATVIQIFDNVKVGNDTDVYTIIDVDGDPRTTDDQRISLTTAKWLSKNPTFKLNVGDRVTYRETKESITHKRVYLSDMIKIR
jgi:hypothetical protein